MNIIRNYLKYLLIKHNQVIEMPAPQIKTILLAFWLWFVKKMLPLHFD